MRPHAGAHFPSELKFDFLARMVDGLDLHQQQLPPTQWSSCARLVDSIFFARKQGEVKK